MSSIQDITRHVEQALARLEAATEGPSNDDELDAAQELAEAVRSLLAVLPVDDRRNKLLSRMEQLAETTKSTVVIGRKGHKEDWFARCDHIEWDGSTPEHALESVINQLVRTANYSKAQAVKAISWAEEVQKLVPSPEESESEE